MSLVTKKGHITLARMSALIMPMLRLKPDEWGKANRVYPAHTGVPGPRDPYLTPYAIPWTRVLGDGSYQRAVLACGAQMGKTDGMLDVIGERMDTKPAPIIYVGPSKEFCVDQFEPRIMQLFEESKTLGAKVAHGKRMKKTRKIVSGVPIRLAHAGSSTALKSDPAALALVDEYDGMLGNIQGQGDPLGLVEARGFTYADFVTGVSSTPTMGAVEIDEPDPDSGLMFWKKSHPDDIKSPIWRLWQDGTRHHWAWPCPHCEEYFIPRMRCLEWELPSSKKEKVTPADARRSAHITCPRCGGRITDDDKPALNAAGVMVAPGQRVSRDGVVHGNPPDSSTVSFWVSGLCSPFQTIGQRAEDLVTAQQSGSANSLQTIVNSRFGECFVNKAGDAPEWQDVKTHASTYVRGVVPEGVVYLVLTADVQKNRIMWIVRGWGARGTSWLIDFGELWGETTEAGVWTDFSDLIKQEFDGHNLKLVFVDSGFRPGKKDELPLNRVYDFCRLYPSLVRPTKGSSHAMRTPLIKSKIEVNRKGGAAKYGLELIRLDTDHWKSTVHEKVRWPDDQPGAWHLPDDVTDDYCKQIVSESKVILDSGRVEWTRLSKDNHFLDCEAMQAAAAFMLNAVRLPTSAKPSRPVPVTPVLTESQSLVTAATVTVPGKRRGISHLLAK